MGTSKVRNVLTPALVIAILLALSLGRNAVWHTPIDLWRDVVGKNADSARVHNNLGNCYVLAGRTLEAIEEYKFALMLDRYYIEAYYNLGSNLDDMGRSVEALPYYTVYCNDAPMGLRKAVACERSRTLSMK